MCAISALSSPPTYRTQSRKRVLPNKNLRRLILDEHPRAYDARTMAKPVLKPGYSGQGRSLDQASIGAGPDPATGFGTRGFPMTRGTYR